ncbi:hypothetical protein ACX0G7_26905 [Flavitalea antarctica]
MRRMWDQVRPADKDLLTLWDDITITSVETFSQAAETFMQNIKDTHTNGGGLLHRFKLSGNLNFAWFASRNRLDEIGFSENLLGRPELKNYRDNLQIALVKPAVKVIRNASDIYDLPGQLARILGHGGAYKNVSSEVAWKIATDFVKEEFQNRFDEILSISTYIRSADWFYDISWDFSVMLFDKRKSEITFIDITDTD